MNRKQGKIFVISITLVIVSIIIMAVLSYQQSQKMNVVSSHIGYTRNVLIQLGDLYNTTILHAGHARNYSMNGKEEELKGIQNTSSILRTKLSLLKEIIRDVHETMVQTDSLEKYLTKRIDHSNQIITTSKEKGSAIALALYETGIGREYNNMIFTVIQKMQAEELSRLQTDQQKNTGSIQRLTTYLLGLLGFIFILIVIIVQKGRMDIAARKKTELQLKNFNQRLREEVKEKAAELTGVFERITDAFIALDKNFCYAYINKKTSEIMNRDPATLIGKNIWDEYPEEKDSPFYKAAYAAMADQEYIYQEAWSPVYQRWFENHFYPSPEGLSIFFRDITQKKKVELALKHSEETTGLIMNAALDAIICIDTTGIITVWTKQAETIFGWTSEEIVGKKLVDTLVPERYKASHETGFEKYLNTGSGPVLNKPIELTALRSSGKEFPIELIIVPIKQDGREFFCSFIRDISERKKAEEAIRKSEERYRALIEQASDAIMITDQRGNFIEVNTSFCTLFGYTKEELKGMNIIRVIDPEQLKEDPVKFDRLLAGDTIFRQRRMMHKDGTIIEVEVNIKMLPDGRMLAIARDVTEKLKAQEDLKKSYEEIRMLASNIENIREEEKIKIAREIHDELGQQLTALKMDVAWLSKKLSTPDATLQQKAKDVLLLLDEMVKSVRRIASELRPGLLDDLGLVAAMEWHSQEFEKRSDIKTKFSHLGKDQPIPTQLSTGLFRIFQESLTNVARHAGAHKIIATLVQGNDSVVLKISDDGKGFDPAEIKGRKTLGLLGMKERAMMMGGKYEIASEPGKGTTVFVEVPLHKVPENVQNN